MDSFVGEGRESVEGLKLRLGAVGWAKKTKPKIPGRIFGFFQRSSQAQLKELTSSA
jgi:hypothetical protein